MCSVGGIAFVIQEEFPKVKKWMVVLGVCVLGCLFGLVYLTPVRSPLIFRCKGLFVKQ